VSDSQARINKSIGYLTTDALTPLIGDYCRLSLKPVDDDDPKTVYTGDKFTNEEAYKISLAWPQDPDDKDLIDQQVAKLLDLEVLELNKMVALFNNYESYKDVPVLLSSERKTKIIAAVGHDLEYPEDAHTVKTSNESEPTRPTRGNKQAKRSNRSRSMEDSQGPTPEVGEPKPVESTGGAPANPDRLGRRRPKGKRTDSGPNGRNPGPATSNRPARNDRDAAAPKPANGKDSKPREAKGGGTKKVNPRPANPLAMTVKKNGLGQGSDA